MTSILKNLFNALSVIGVIALIIFFIQLIALNTGGDSSDTPVVSEANENNGAAQPTGGVDAENPSGGVEAQATSTPTPRPPPTGYRYPIPVDIETGTTLVVYAATDKFEFDQSSDDWEFHYLGGGDITLSIGYAYMDMQSVPGEVATKYLYDLTGDDTAEYRGQFNIVDSDMIGYNAQLRSGDLTYEVWLYRLTDKLALAFSYSFAFDEQRDDIYEVLSSMEIEQG